MSGEIKSNHLIHETSPYLLQHAHNPVDWYPWGEEALQKAIKEDKPILVSIGYAACHWCHVMERESFENDDTALYMNEHFINIKIDREERPDLDQIYMDAVQAIAGNGGWPLNVFLTPEGKPFYGGTYFPPVKAFNRSSWIEVLHFISKLFIEQREEVNNKADELTAFISRDLPIVASGRSLETITNKEEIINEEQFNDIFKNIIKQADKKWGGFGNAPKFPQTFTINSLLRFYFYTKNTEALDQACLSLNKMLEGGIYDQIGGGFSRYSTDAEWLAPHFEKMLYDNALLIVSLSEAFQITHNENYKLAVYETIAFINRELKHSDGGYYAALDADSEGEEGKYYVWDYDQVVKLLGRDGEIFCSFYNIVPEGNWEGKNILRKLETLENFASKNNLSLDHLSEILNKGRSILLNERQKRIRPATDDKIILSWNALMIIALCKASSAFSNLEFLNEAEENYAFLMDHFLISDHSIDMHHNYKNGQAKNPAFLDDYAFLISACIHLQECTSKNKYLVKAKALTEYVLENFASDDMFYYTPKDQKDVIIRKKEIYDGALPSANAVMNANLFYLGTIFDIQQWKEIAHTNSKQVSGVSINYPSSFGVWNNLLISLYKGINEVAITGGGFEDFRNRILKEFIPSKIIQCSNDPVDVTFPLIHNRINKDGKTLIYVCKDFSCKAPVEEVEWAIKELLK